MQFPSHGANYESLYQNFQIEMPNVVHDLSENVNYLGVPSGVRDVWPNLLSLVPSYPHPKAEPLRSTLAIKHNVQAQNILVGNGAAELLTFFALRLAGKRVILIHPTFSEYKATLQAAGAEIVEITVQDVGHYQLPINEIKHEMNNASCLYLCNPNNPTGTLISRDVVEDFIVYGKNVGCEVIVDEAFMDWTDERNSVISCIGHHSNVTVLRSMTKMYAIAGIRLGYLVSCEEIVFEIESKLPHWHVNAVAIAIGEACLQDENFRLKSIEQSNLIKKDLEAFLHKYECVVTKSATNFLCFQLKDVEKTRDFYFHCLERGIVLRHTENFHSMDGKWLRIGMKGSAAMSRFKKVLEEWYE